MTEDEKRRIAMEFMAQEMNRSPVSLFLDAQRTRASAIIRKTEKQQAVFAALAQHGITWQELKKAYDESVEQGKRDMIDFRMTFFYASTAIALHETLGLSSDEIMQFLERLASILGEEHSLQIIVSKAKEKTGVDVSNADTPPQPVVKTRADRKTAERMRRTGIKPADLEEERQIGYQHGWNTAFYTSACYAAVALTMKELYSADAKQIESLLDRMGEITDEEISRADILERCSRETGLDVSGIIQR